MAVPILTENSILVYDLVHSRSKIPFENHAGAHNLFYAFASLFAYSGKPLRKDVPKTLNRMVNTTQSMRQRRIGLEFFQNLLWALAVWPLF